MAEDYEKFLNRKLKLAPEIFRKHFQRAGLLFIGQIQERWYSGRKEDDTGLYVNSGEGRRSWHPQTEIKNNDVVTTIGTSAKYLKDHEFGKGNLRGVVASAPKKPKSKKPIDFELKNLPKRTFVTQDFHNAKIGKAIFQNEIRKALKAVVKV